MSEERLQKDIVCYTFVCVLYINCFCCLLHKGFSVRILAVVTQPQATGDSLLRSIEDFIDTTPFDEFYPLFVDHT